MAELRRLRTQAERDADGTTWRLIDFGPAYGDKAGPGTSAERVEEMRAAIAESAATGKAVLLADGSLAVSYVLPRRRWWHRLTRRAR